MMGEKKIVMDIDIRELKFRTPFPSGYCPVMAKVYNESPKVMVMLIGPRGGFYGRLVLPRDKAREMGVALLACAEEDEQKGSTSNG